MYVAISQALVSWHIFKAYNVTEELKHTAPKPLTLAPFELQF